MQRLAEATDTLEGAGSRMRELVRLLARSRKVELDVISPQFGALIEPGRLNQIEQDLRDFEAMLEDE